jgi:hypothetical protein
MQYLAHGWELNLFASRKKFLGKCRKKSKHA